MMDKSSKSIEKNKKDHISECPVQSKLNDPNMHENNDRLTSCPIKSKTSTSETSPSFLSYFSWFQSTDNKKDIDFNDKKLSTMKQNEAQNDILFENKTDSSPQASQLNTSRIISSIPKSDFTPDHQPKGENLNENWVYPSEQQYYNAMKKKGYNPNENDVPVILAIHNIVNEQGWLKIKEWEALRGCETPKLKRFMGKPKNISPKAFICSFILGYKPPFDRHDWLVESNGREVRYVIDFYQGKQSSSAAAPVSSVHEAPLESPTTTSKSSNSSSNTSHPTHTPAAVFPNKSQISTHAPIAMYLDVRPAVDSFSAVYDRMYVSFREYVFGQSDFLSTNYKSSQQSKSKNSNSGGETSNEKRDRSKDD